MVMLYSLTNSPSTFQAFMYTVFQDMINRFIIVYIDDILIYSPSLSLHVDHVRPVLQRLFEYLFVKGEKCEFHQTQVQFLGYVI